jgi:hypothetical protein
MPDNYSWLNNPLDVAERLVLDVASKIQLTPTHYNIAQTNYNALAELADGGDHQLTDRIVEIYPSGSFAIGAAILGQVRAEQHDVDVVLEVDLPLNSDPQTTLRALYDAIRGDAGSTYHDMTTLNSRCVTVTYKDGRTIDLMPIVRQPDTPERVGQLFHWKQESGESYHKDVNPSGFAQHFRDRIRLSETFQMRFTGRMVLLEKAETQPMPEHEPLHMKAPRLVALQLIKRARNLRYRKSDRKGLYRPPPSVVLAALALQASQTSDYLIDETITLAKTISNAIDDAERAGTLLEVFNPAWSDDCFTDRWPESRTAQSQFSSDLKALASDLGILRRGAGSPDEQKRILKRHFGETPSQYALNEMGRIVGEARKSGRTSVTGVGTVGVLGAAAPSIPKRDPFGGDPV